MAAIDQKIREIIVEEFGGAEAAVTPAASFVEDLGANSFDLIEVFAAFEEAFEIQIPDEEAERIRTVQDAIDCVTKHAQGGGRWSPSNHGVTRS